MLQGARAGIVKARTGQSGLCVPDVGWTPHFQRPPKSSSTSESGSEHPAEASSGLSAANRGARTISFESVAQARSLTGYTFGESPFQNLGTLPP